ncbi:6aceb237-a33e-4520-a008-8514f1a36584 [Thermothielavioides terrestris]|uniref:Uncharacterized protein n=2 Tax=Thermothielavioides terrestris TaxID=2587410 RepID=G2RFS8_THETT|nr:uncharacterized protein THITE_2124403 [Thermothielavioides terrestris NRRL 8126]AEO71682.1 hypothetical protein THITE_2124403 [Thermothielavioides terrestris NRRL 8126]SPQ27332.1 6aceb237-a33e-4520-a008-8514f1a36584 [Thermothielavioides terrestris]
MATLLSRSSDSPRYSLQDIELARFDSASPSILSAPPPYEEPASRPFRPTVHLQIETLGKPWFSTPLPPRPDPIPVFALHPDDSSSSAAAHAPQFTSIRPWRSSGSCYLTPYDTTTTTTASSSSAAGIPVLSTTTYRFGPNRPPRVRLFAPHSAPLSPAALEALLLSAKDAATIPDPEEDGQPVQQPPQPWDEFAITSAGLLTRAVTFRTRLGTFQWRYASRRERLQQQQQQEQQDGDKISSLLVLERVVRVARARNLPPTTSTTTSTSFPGLLLRRHQHEDEEVRTTVAHFVRGAATRTAGSSVASAGNGGRLVLDLGLWGEGEECGGGEDAKVAREMAVVMAVTTCLVMLKREVDRRRAQQMATMAHGGGGP